MALEKSVAHLLLKRPFLESSILDNYHLVSSFHFVKNVGEELIKWQLYTQDPEGKELTRPDTVRFQTKVKHKDNIGWACQLTLAE